MSGFLLDTNIISELRKKDRADARVQEWFDRNNDAELWLSVLVVAELRRGIELRRRRDKIAASTLWAWLESLVIDHRDRILPVTIEIAQRWGVLSVPDPLPWIDGLLAATALEHALTLATRNTDDVIRTGVALVNPFAAE